MIELVMTVCLLTAPTDCRKERIAAEGTMMQCMMAGQIAAAEWIATHPKWRLKRWRCGPPSKEA